MYHYGILENGYTERVNTEDGPDERWVTQFDIGCSDDKGHRWVLATQGFATQEEAEAALAKVEARKSSPETEPDVWFVDRPIYGSEARGAEDEHELACFEADRYDEPRPVW